MAVVVARTRAAAFRAVGQSRGGDVRGGLPGVRGVRVRMDPTGLRARFSALLAPVLALRPRGACAAVSMGMVPVATGTAAVMVTVVMVGHRRSPHEVV